MKEALHFRYSYFFSLILLGKVKYALACRVRGVVAYVMSWYENCARVV